jgi:hypothetical protein
VQLPRFLAELLGTSKRTAPAPGSVKLTRKLFYDLAAYCRDYALELARYDQTRVSLKHCHAFNDWLATLQRYDRLAKPLAGLTPARPIARWQVMTVAGLLGLIGLLAFGGRMDQRLFSMLSYGLFFSLLIFFFVPERLYGTTIELLEAKVLRVVDSLEQLLLHEDLGLTEAAYFRVKENLEAARRELRQQIDLAHRR